MQNLFLFLCKRLFVAFQGYILWHNIVHKNKLPGDCAVILVPDPVDEECALYAVKYLTTFFRCSGFNSAIFLSDYPQLNNLIDDYQVRKNVTKVIPLKKKKLDQIIAFKTANLDDIRLIIASLDIPYSRNGLNFLRSGALSKEEAFLIGIYNSPEGSELNQLSGGKLAIVRR